jgi:hypothetical protein
MNPDQFRYMSPTGLKRAETQWVGRVEIICLDRYQRLPMNWAIKHKGYHEFRTLSAAKKFAKAI